MGFDFSPVNYLNNVLPSLDGVFSNSSYSNYSAPMYYSDPFAPNDSTSTGSRSTLPSVFSNSSYGNTSLMDYGSGKLEDIFNVNSNSYDDYSLARYYDPYTYSLNTSSYNNFGTDWTLSNNYSSNNSSSVGNLSLSRVSNPSSTAESVSSQHSTYKIGKFDLDFWKSKGYNHQKGMELALDAYQIKKGERGQCVGYTRETINRVYGTNFDHAGKACNFGRDILSSPQLKGKFKKVDMKDVAIGGIPDGAVVLWRPGAPGYTKGKAATCGHGGIAYQNKVYSNFVATNLSTCYEVWIPV